MQVAVFHVFSVRQKGNMSVTALSLFHFNMFQTSKERMDSDGLQEFNILNENFGGK